MNKTIVIKKYANRRLYNTETSAYVTLNQVADYIRQGRQVSITDAKTKEDVTAFILTQIVLEEAKNRNTLLPDHLLHLIIRYGDNLLGEFLEKYFSQIFQHFVAHKSVMDSQFQKWLEIGLNISETAQKNFGKINPFQSALDPFGSFSKKNDKKK
ncbi:MAG: transcriptional regulator [Desulfobacteraceae bacterium]|nr:transcriptional regulator [Desulfobacteraceae bacterium]